MMGEALDKSGLPLRAETLALMADWWRRVREGQIVHYECSGFFSRLHFWIGVPTVLLATAAGAEAFSSLAREAGTKEKMIVGSVSLLAAGLAALQTFLGPSKRADAHRAIAAGYAAVRRELEQLKTFPPGAPEIEKVIADVRLQMDSLAKIAPEMPALIKKRAEARLKEKGDEGIFSKSGGEPSPVRSLPG